MTKQELRKHIKQILLEKSGCIEELSEKICINIIESDAYKNADAILGYMALPDEVNLKTVLDAASEHKKVFIPLVDPHSSQMDFYAYKNQDYQKGSFGIQEPSTETQMFDFTGNVLILVPGRAFTKDGKRLGRGKGYYDTFLSRLIASESVKFSAAGVCFSFQLLDDIPVESHDILMDSVITEL